MSTSCKYHTKVDTYLIPCSFYTNLVLLIIYSLYENYCTYNLNVKVKYILNKEIIYIHIHTYTYIYIHIHTHAHTHAYTYMYFLT